MIPQKKRQKVFDRDGNRCLRCGSTKDLTIDHIKPKCKGGTSCYENLQTLCLLCNQLKDASTKNYRTTNGERYRDRRLDLLKADIVPSGIATKTRLARAESIVKKLITGGESIKVCRKEYKRLSGLSKGRTIIAFEQIYSNIQSAQL